MKQKHSLEYKQSLFKYSLGEDIANSVSHAFGLLFGIYALISLVYVSAKYGNLLDTFVFSFYGLSIIFVFFSSMMYHALTNVTARIVFKKLDHIAIYWTIIGTYTPLVFSITYPQHFEIILTIYIILFSIAVIGTVLKCFNQSFKYKTINTLIYLFMGWLVLIRLDVFILHLSFIEIVLIVMGAVSYTIGALLYAFFKFKYSHFVWHIFVLAGIVTHFVMINFFLLQGR